MEGENQYQEIVYMIGYGTFITNKTFLKSSDVDVCIVPQYRRLWLKTTIYPFILPDKSSNGLHALIFSVKKDILKNLDVYEGVEAGLYTRELINVTLISGEPKTAYIYIPTQKCIEEFALTFEKDPNDNWLDEIKKFPDIIEKYPELL